MKGELDESVLNDDEDSDNESEEGNTEENKENKVKASHRGGFLSYKAFKTCRKAFFLAAFFVFVHCLIRHGNNLVKRHIYIRFGDYITYAGVYGVWLIGNPVELLICI